jgi:O-antigen/teichoic acid export membrane protein
LKKNNFTFNPNYQRNLRLGIIKRQAYSGTILSYIGVVIGFITTALIFPEFLSTSEIGLLGIFMSYAYIFGQLATFGIGRVTIVFFPYFRDRDKNHHGFFPLMVTVAITGLAISLLIVLLLKKLLISNANDESVLFAEYFNYLFPLVLFTLVFLVMDTFNTTLFNAVRGIFLKEFLQRAAILASVVLYILSVANFDDFVLLYVLSLGIPGLILLYFVLRNKEFRFKPSWSPLIREKSGPMLNIGINGIFIGFSGMIMLYVDRIMVERFMGLGSTGIYTTVSYFATLIAIPSRALLKISDPVIAKSWKDNDMKTLQDNYYRSSLNQFLIGSLLLAGLWGNIGNILRILPEDYADGKYVVLFLGLAFLSDMVTGTATYILANSKYFKYQTYYIILLVILTVMSNYFLIPVWGLTGAAIATLSSKIISNFIRYQILYHKCGLQPYNTKFLVIILVAVIAYLAQYFIAEHNNLYMDILFRSAIISVVFIALALGLGISPEVNERFRWLVSKVLKRD